MNLHPENLAIHIEQDYARNTINIWVLDKTFENFNNISINKNNRIESKPIDPTTVLGPEHKPFLSLPKMFADGLFKAIAEHNSEQGIKTKSDHNIQGQLTAKSEHLVDLQMIVKKVLKIE